MVKRILVLLGEENCTQVGQIGSDWPQMGQIREIFRSDSVHFGAPRQNVLKLILKNPRLVLFGGNMTKVDVDANSDMPGFT